MMKFSCNDEAAIKIAVDLAKANLEECNFWVPSEKANQFIDEVFTFLTMEEQSNQE